MLDNVRRALMELDDEDLWRAATAVYLVAVFGESVTSTLAKIKKYDRPRFETWWARFEQVKSSDPVLMFFTQVRNAFLKEGGGYHSGSYLFGSAGEWYLTDAPLEHQGQPIPCSPFLDPPRPSINTLGQLYVEWLQSVLDETAMEFAGMLFTSRFDEVGR